VGASVHLEETGPFAGRRREERWQSRAQKHQRSSITEVGDPLAEFAEVRCCPQAWGWCPSLPCCWDNGKLF
jgi:hypothetical protein